MPPMLPRFAPCGKSVFGPNLGPKRYRFGEMAMTSKDDPIPEDVREAFARAAMALFDWSSTGGDEPTIVVHGSPTLISIVATLAESYKEMMPTDLYWRLVHHANCSPRRRLQASKLSHDSSYATGAKCLLEWVQDKEGESKVYTPAT
jgi:hypothetical protein